MATRRTNLRQPNRRTRSVGGPPAHNQSVTLERKRPEILARQRKAWKLHAEDGLTFAQIGAKLGVSDYTAYYDMVAHSKRLQELGLAEDVELLRAIHKSRVEKIISLHLPKAGVSKESARIVLDALEREAKLMGLDLKRDTGYSVDAIERVMLAITRVFIDAVQEGVPVTESRRMFAAGVRRLSGIDVVNAIDAKVEKVG